MLGSLFFMVWILSSKTGFDHLSQRRLSHTNHAGRKRRQRQTAMRISIGSIVEPIDVWNPGRELRFSVISQPPLMRELSPFSDVHPPHLKLKYLRSKKDNSR